tara:strand:+ start:108 stop:1100 length:993 start_codon:yes stop_codon:yes gene_type:complete
MTVNIGNTVQWPVTHYYEPDIKSDNARFANMSGRSHNDRMIELPGYANNGDYFLVKTYENNPTIAYHNSSRSQVWIKAMTDFDHSGVSAAATNICGVCLIDEKLYVTVCDGNATNGTEVSLAYIIADGSITSLGHDETGVTSYIGNMGLYSMLTRPQGKTNLYLKVFHGCIEINITNGAFVENHHNSIAADNGYMNFPATFMSSSLTAMHLRCYLLSGSVHSMHMSWDLPSIDPNTGITLAIQASNYQGIQDLIPLYLTPFGSFLQASGAYERLFFVDWGGYYYPVIEDGSGTGTPRTTLLFGFEKSRMDAWSLSFEKFLNIAPNGSADS